MTFCCKKLFDLLRELLRLYHVRFIVEYSLYPTELSKGNKNSKKIETSNGSN